MRKKTNPRAILTIVFLVLLLFTLFYFLCNRNENNHSQTSPQGRIILRAYLDNSLSKKYHVIMDGNGEKLQLLGYFRGSAVWSHDGKFVAAGCNDAFDSICIYDASTIVEDIKYPVPLQYLVNPLLVKRIQITEACLEAVSEDRNGIRLSWSADGQKITAICNSTAIREDDKNLVCTYDLNGSSVCWTSGINNLRKIKYATWSPVKNDLAVSGNYDSPDEREGNIYLTDAKGNNPRFLTKGWAPAWSRDGRQIAFFKHLDSKFTSTGIGAIDADGQNFHWLFPTPQIEADLRKINYVQGIFDRTYEFTAIDFEQCDDGDRCSLTWSPDGQYIMFTGTYIYMYNTKLFRLNIKTGEIIMPLNISRWVLDPDWGPN